jgi:hypothetical protein
MTAFLSTAMGMPQEEAYENRNLWDVDWQGSVSFLLPASSKFDSLDGDEPTSFGVVSLVPFK